MWESSTIVENTFNDETHKILCESQIHKFGMFLDHFNEELNNNSKKFTNINNVTLKPIKVQDILDERTSVLYLTNSDSSILSKILSSLAFVYEEIEILIRECDKFCSTFIFYGEVNMKRFENIETISLFLGRFQKLHNFIQRVHQITSLMLQQLCAILVKGYYVSSNTSSFSQILNSFSELLVGLVTVEQLLDSKILKDHWILYRRSIRNLLHNCSKYNLNVEQVRCLNAHLITLEYELLSGIIFKNMLERTATEALRSQIKGCTLNLEFNMFLNGLITELEKDDDEILYTQKVLQLNTLMVFSFHLFEKNDKRMFKRVLDLNRKISACNLIGNIIWYPEPFLLRYVQPFKKLIDEKSVENNRILQINSKCQSLPKESNFLCVQASYWMIEIGKLRKKNVNTLTVKHLNEIYNLLVDGFKLANKISFSIKFIINLHADKDLPVTKSVLLSLCKLIEVLKCIYIIFNSNSTWLVYLILLISQHLSHRALTILHNMRKQFNKDKLNKQHLSDILSALIVCEKCIKGPNTNKRILVANLAISASGLNNDNINEVHSILSRLHLISNFSHMLKISCNCSFLYWHQTYILPVYFSKLINTKANLSRYYLIMSALSDCAIMAGDNKVTEMTDLALIKNFVGPLNQIVETNLRLQTHLHLTLPPTDPIQNYFALNFSKYLPANMHADYKNIKNEAQHYLSMMFYNLTTVVLHDWKTYGEMRRLAFIEYSLETVDDNLPMQTLEQGLDVLEIMRNINVFVNKYLYNLNSQVFIEESSNNKHLNSINISHVANSIRTHGTGIMNTTVNFIYQFLRNQFHIFSEFMFDEHIKSRLMKDVRFFSEHKADLNQMYPYERAEKFNFGIRKLGLNNLGQSYLDLFRKVITHIGNAMGYIRLIRSGGRRCLADGTCFIPDLKDIESLCNTIKDEPLSTLSRNASTCLLHDLDNFVDNFEEATEYFQLLVKVFEQVFRDRNNMHLKYFYIIVPSLTINFIEHSLTCKERLNKKNKADCAFTDDGFALGLAYVIELLDQEGQLNSLHWFHSVQKKFKSDSVTMNKQKLVANADDDKLKQTLALTEKRIFTFAREFQLLYYSFNSARLFFQK